MEKAGWDQKQCWAVLGEGCQNAACDHSKNEVSGGVIRYTRTFEVKELSVPVSRADELKAFYRTIASDERNTAVLKPKGN